MEDIQMTDPTQPGQAFDPDWNKPRSGRLDIAKLQNSSGSYEFIPMSKLKCIFPFHKWGAWKRGLQSLNDELSIIEIRKCEDCPMLDQRKIWL